MLNKKYIEVLLLLFVTGVASAQKVERDFIRKGNRLYKDSVYVDAEVNYRKALEVNPQSTIQCLIWVIHCCVRISYKKQWNNLPVWLK